MLSMKGKLYTQDNPICRKYLGSQYSVLIVLGTERYACNCELSNRKQYADAKQEKMYYMLIN